MSQKKREAVAKALDALGVTVVYADDPVDGSRIQVVLLDDLARIGDVQEPSAHDGDCEADWGSEGQESPCRCAERAQGEPTDAQVTAALHALYAVQHPYSAPGELADYGDEVVTAVRAALRAAYEVQAEEVVTK